MLAYLVCNYIDYEEEFNQTYYLQPQDALKAANADLKYQRELNETNKIQKDLFELKDVLNLKKHNHSCYKKVDSYGIHTVIIRSILIKD